MDGNDRTKLSALEKARREHIARTGSMLGCERAPSGLCSHMHGAWLTGCQRKPCIVDDPEYIREQKRIEKQKRRNAALKQREELADQEHSRPSIKSHVQKEMEAIAKLEERSRQAFYDNDPKLGEDLFNKARYRRGELRKYIQGKIKEEHAHDQDHQDREDLSAPGQSEKEARRSGRAHGEHQDIWGPAESDGSSA